ncbi:MAG: hypothetical protein ACYCPF_03425 [Streptosporangiaceae bacterium]
MPIRHPLAAGPVPSDRPPAGPAPARVRRRRRWLAAGAVAAAAAALAGCGRMGAALSQQWIDVQLAPTTTVVTARHIVRTCSHVPNMKPYPIEKTTSYSNLVGVVRFDATNASPADMSRLQTCLQRFPQVQGFTQGQAGGDS